MCTTIILFNHDLKTKRGKGNTLSSPITTMISDCIVYERDSKAYQQVLPIKYQESQVLYNPTRMSKNILWQIAFTG